MAIYVCSELLPDASCAHWVSIADLLTVEQAAQIGGAFLAVTATAWGFSFIVRFILGMSPGRF